MTVEDAGHGRRREHDREGRVLAAKIQERRGEAKARRSEGEPRVSHGSETGTEP
jgi:hypothetical protein